MSLPVLRADLLAVVVDVRHPLFLVILQLDLHQPLLLLRLHGPLPGPVKLPETELRWKMETVLEVLVARLYLAQRGTAPAGPSASLVASCEFTRRAWREDHSTGMPTPRRTA